MDKVWSGEMIKVIKLDKRIRYLYTPEYNVSKYFQSWCYWFIFHISNSMISLTFRLANGGSVGGSLNNEGKHEENSKNANILLKKKVRIFFSFFNYYNS